MRIGHIGTNTFLHGYIFQAVADDFATLIGGLNQRFRFGGLIDDLANQRNAFTQTFVISHLLITESRVHFVLFTRHVMTQGDSHDRDPQRGNAVDHLMRGIVGDKHHLRMQRHQFLRINMRQIPKHSHMVQLRGESGIAVAQLLLPVRHHPDDFIGGVHLHQQVQRLVLKHYNAVNVVRNRNLTANLVGDLA